MKLTNLIYATGIAVCLSSCILSSPAYFGTTYSATTKVQTFYSTGDIKAPFEVIGHMNITTGSSQNGQERARASVIEKAKEIGADAVVFSDLNRQVNHKTTDDFTIKVEVIKFKKP
ncbi:hypothetical protein ACJVDH_03810 [Pedobacter sp. AW1-32]|uniref:hypothetical protein n=1 Tax=Pedobacter sp. AW1-32 TaxID=3383026 RepID=UPI003FEDFF46